MDAIPNYDIHSHTVYCGHAHALATPQHMAQCAAAQGLAVYGISEHCLTTEHAAWLTAIRQDTAGLDLGDMRLLIGVELDADPLTEDGRFRVYPEVDYVIMAQHFLPGGKGHWEFRPAESTATERAAIGARWLDWYEATVTQGGFEILAHPLREPMRLQLVDLRDAATFRRVVQIMDRAARAGMAFELNNGWLQGVVEIGQQAEFLALAREARALGMRFSRGSDAHAPAEVGGADAIRAFATTLGLRAADWLQIDALLALHQANAAAMLKLAD